MTIRVDAHQHFWDLNRTEFEYGWLGAEGNEAINRSFMPSDLVSRMSQVGIDKTVFVQTQHDIRENTWALELANENPFIAGVVGWVDLASDVCEEQLAQFADDPKFVGIRHITQDEPDVDFIVRDEIITGLKVLEKHNIPFDLLFYVQHVHHAKTVASLLPNLPLVIDHISKPEIKAGRMDNWTQHIQDVAKHEHVYCKLSGMITEADWQHWTPSDLKPYVEVALEAFGVERCMFGSDWPVCELAGTYDQVYDALCQVIGPLSDSEMDRLFGGTAIDFYRLKV